MHLRELELDEFRSFRELRLPIDAVGLRAIGPNASGKSTLLEAIAMLATTRSPRTSSEREIAHWRSGVDLSVPPYARLRGVFDRLDGDHQIELRMSVDETGHGSLKKQARFDDRPVRAVDVVGQLKVVLFSPEDVELISGSPSGRRRYLDMAISQASRGYLRALSRYGRVLEQRNSLLRDFARARLGSASPRPARELPFWNVELGAAAVDVLAIRLGAVAFLSSRANLHFARLTGDDSLAMTYRSTRLEVPEGFLADEHWQDPTREFRQTLSASFARILEESRAEELRRGVTAVGPHRDDFEVTAGGVNLGRFGSRGQQRLAVIAIKLGELDLLEEAAGESPVLLLDDVLSELDMAHRNQLTSTLAARTAQICLTATDGVEFELASLAHLPLVRIRDGSILTHG